MGAFIYKIIKSFGQNEVRRHASSAAFYIVVSALPLITILVYATSCLSPALQDELEPFLEKLLPRAFSAELFGILTNIRQKRLPFLVPFSTIAALWGSTKGVEALCSGTEAIYGTKRRRPLVLHWLKTAGRTLAFYVAFIGSLLISALGKLYVAPSAFVYLLLSLRIVLFALFLSFFLAYFYARLANSPLKKHLLGGTVAALGWMAFTFLYSIYVSYALSSLSIYAEVGTAIFFMLWVYFCVNIILVGAEINKAIFPK